MAGSSRDDDAIERKRPSGAVLFLRDAAIAFVFVASILLAMFAYTGIWPPLVVVESDSMMHSEDNVSHIGVIDTGDMVLVKGVDAEDGVVSYVEGFSTGHETYGDYGDVIVYRKMGSEDNTPIIHRAIVYLEANPDGLSYSCEALHDLPADKWSVGGTDSWDHLTSILTIYDVGYKEATVSINIGYILDEFRRDHRDPTSGFITRGDHNSQIDQAYRATYVPVDVSWVVGKARGEIPWFGLLKLWFTDSLRSEAPENSVRNLWIAMALIVVVPIIIDVVLTFRTRKRIARRREAARREFEEERCVEPPTEDERPKTDPGPPPEDAGGTETAREDDATDGDGPVT